MKKNLLVLSLMSSVLPLSGAEAATKPVPVTTKESASFIDKVYVNGLGVIKVPNFTGKEVYGAGAEVGYQVNNKVGIGVQNLAYATPDNWGGSAIDETAGVVHWTLFSANKVSLGGIGSVTHSWTSDAWAIGAGAELKYSFTKRVSAGVGGVVRFWNDGKSKEDVLLSASVGVKL